MTYILPKDRPGFTQPKPKKKLNHPESDMQEACVLWFDYQYASIKHLLYANGNGGKRNKVEAKIMKAEGIRAGIPDLTLAIPRANWHGLYIEMKLLPNQPTTEQRMMMERLTQQGYYCQVVYTFEQFRELITNYLKLPPYGQSSD